MKDKKRESNIGNFIRKRRKERNITQKQLAEFAEVSFTFVNRVENGDLDVTLSTLNKVLAVFNSQVGAIPLLQKETIEE